jgi:hypothetical protein
MESLRTSVREKEFKPLSQETFLGTGNKQYYTRDEFMNELAKRLGRHYGLNDIREAL